MMTILKKPIISLGERKVLISGFICLAFSYLQAQSWQAMADFPSTERDDGLSFVIGNKAFCGTGYETGWTETGDFYSFDFSTLQWAPIASLPSGMERQYAAGFSAYNFGYVFGGVKTGVFLNDLWQYNLELNLWTQQASLPSVGRSGSASFVLNGIAYVIGGKNSTEEAIDEVWAYDIQLNTWVQKNNLAFGSRFRASGVALNNKGYLIFGRDENNQYHNELYEYNPATDSWIELSEFPSDGRMHSSLHAVGNKLLVLAGVDSNANYYNDMWSFNRDSLLWEEYEPIPSFGRKGGMSFSNGIDVFYTTGINQENIRLKESWKASNPTGIRITASCQELLIYPNPLRDFLFLEIPGYIPSETCFFSLYDSFGQRIEKGTLTQSITEIDMEDRAEGVYLLRLERNGCHRTHKLVKQ
jgi:N-acetylneuraminic acid mutarotase